MKILLPILMFLAACSSPEKKEEKPEKTEYEIAEDRQKAIDSLNNLAVKKLSEKYNAFEGWDTISQPTFYYQELFSKSNLLISFRGYIIDEIKVANGYLLKIKNSDRPILAEIIIDSLIHRKLLSQKNRSNKGCFIIIVNGLSSNIPVLKAEIDTDEGEAKDATAFVELDYSLKTIIIRGKLIDYYKNVEDDQEYKEYQ